MSIELKFQHELAILTLRRPEALDALSFPLLREISAAIDEVGASSARALIVAGAGEEAFCAGADIKELQDRSLREQDAVQLLGGYGYCKDFRVERLMRDAKITQIWEGTNQVHRQLIGRSFLQK